MHNGLMTKFSMIRQYKFMYEMNFRIYRCKSNAMSFLSIIAIFLIVDIASYSKYTQIKFLLAYRKISSLTE